MLTIDDVAAVPLFSALPAIELERLARTSADIHLSSGEFAVHEGGEPALFAVLSGKIEVIKTIDGVERRLGWRIPGTIFGEVPITLGTSFPGGYRAAEPSRVMQIDLQQYYAIAAVSQDILRQVAALARERLGGLQSIAAEPHKPRVTVVGQRWDQACSHLRRFLARNQVSFTWLTPDAPELANLWPGTRPNNDWPVARFADGEDVVRPEPRDIANRLGLQTSPRATEYDVAIVGGGPAGLTAAVYGASEGLRTIVVEREAVTLVVRGDSLEKSMSHYLIDQLRRKSNVATQLRSEIQAVYGDTHLTAVDIHDRTSKEVRRHDCGGLFVFIGADAETQWLPAEIARDARGYVLTGDDLKRAGRWSHDRDPYLLETSVPGVFACGDVRLSPVKRVASAVGEGSLAIAFVQQFLASDG